MQKQSDRIAALYYRAANKQTDSLNLDNQMQKLLCHTKNQGFDNFVIYVDNGTSGLSENRPAFDILKADIGAGHINQIVVTDIARITRSSVYAIRFFKWLRSFGVQVTDTDGNTLSEVFALGEIGLCFDFLKGGERQ
jgi:DNA invertase Pin-like site-specific DNA recombinase